MNRLPIHCNWRSLFFILCPTVCHISFLSEKKNKLPVVCWFLKNGWLLYVVVYFIHCNTCRLDRCIWKECILNYYAVVVLICGAQMKNKNTLTWLDPPLGVLMCWNHRHFLSIVFVHSPCCLFLLVIVLLLLRSSVSAEDYSDRKYARRILL